MSAAVAGAGSAAATQDNVLGGAPAPAGNTPAPASTGSQGSGQAAAPSWRDSLSETIRGDATLSKYQDLESLANAHISLQRMVGSDKIPVPGKNASEADWQNVFKKLGLPDSVDKYEMKAPESVKDENFLKAFKTEAMKAGVLPTQAEKLLNWYAGVDGEAQKQIATQRQAQTQAAIDGLKQEWGEAWDRKVQEAKMGVEWAGGEELRTYLQKTGLGSDPVMIKLMQKVGTALSEGKVRGEGTQSFGLSADEAQSKINQMMSDANHPYHNRNHADHARTVQEVNRLFQVIHGKK